MDTENKIKQQIAQHDVLLYMKGTPSFPMCGFSSKVSHILQQLNAKFNYVNILENQDIRAELPKYANWPTFPQLYIKGELIGGCDIVMEMFEKNQLLALLQDAQAIAATTEFLPVTQ